MVDIGFLATGVALVATCRGGWGQGLWRGLAASWLLVFVAGTRGATMAEIVFAMALMDLAIASIALTIATFDRTRLDARAIGMVSIAMMPGHWVMSVSHGAPDWSLYMAACNGGFVFQCLIAGGWLNGLGRRIRRLFGRRDPAGPVRGGSR